MNFLYKKKNINCCLYRAPNGSGGNGRPSSPIISCGNISNFLWTIHGNLSHAHSCNNIGGPIISHVWTWDAWHISL